MRGLGDRDRPIDSGDAANPAAVMMQLPQLLEKAAKRIENTSVMFAKQCCKVLQKTTHTY